MQEEGGSDSRREKASAVGKKAAAVHAGPTANRSCPASPTKVWQRAAPTLLDGRAWQPALSSPWWLPRVPGGWLPPVPSVQHSKILGGQHNGQWMGGCNKLHVPVATTSTLTGAADMQGQGHPHLPMEALAGDDLDFVSGTVLFQRQPICCPGTHEQ